VLALYALEKESFSKDQLEILLSIETVFAMAVENTLQGRQANVMNESLAGLVNASAAHELAARRASSR